MRERKVLYYTKSSEEPQKNKQLPLQGKTSPRHGTCRVGHARQPEDLRHGIHGPVPDVIRPLDQVAHPSPQRLEGRVALGPRQRHLMTYIYVDRGWGIELIVGIGSAETLQSETFGPQP